MQMDAEIVFYILNFLMGMLAGYLLRLCWVKHQIKEGCELTMPTFKMNRRATLVVGVLVILAGTLFTGVQSWQTDRAIRQLTMETQRCYREFSESLEARRSIAAEDAVVSRKQRDAFAANDEAMLTWLSTLLNPPPDIAALSPQDQRRREWSIGITQEFNKVMASSRSIVVEAREQERESDEERKQHPLPEPTCGLE